MSYTLSDAPYSLQTSDWNREWMDAHRYRAHANSSAYWDMRSKTYDSADNASDYVTHFISLCKINPHQTVFDMGCGTGSITIPLADAGCHVTAADFSKGMLDQTKDRIQRLPEQTRKRITLTKLSWEDNWSLCGIQPKSFDVVVASRSIATDDFDDVCHKMSETARQKCCMTLPTTTSPRIDTHILHEIGIDLSYGRAYQYAWNILVNKGYMPECRYITSYRHDTYNSEDEAWNSFARMLHSALPHASSQEMHNAEQRMHQWVHAHIQENNHAGLPGDKGEIQKKYCLSSPRMFKWAFISWTPTT